MLLDLVNFIANSKRPHWLLSVRNGLTISPGTLIWHLNQCPFGPFVQRFKLVISID